MKIRLPLWIVIILVFAAAALGVFWLWPGQEDNGVETAIVSRGDVEDVVTASGTLQPRDYVDVGTQVSGQIRKLHVDVGSQVKAGELLAELDPTVYRSRVDADRAQLNNQRAQLQERKAQLTLAGQQYARQQNLLRENATTDEALQTAEATLRSTEAQIEALKAQIEQSESTLRGDEANLGYTKIYAPMAGTIVSLSAKQGQTLNANQQAPVVLRIADLSTMTVQTQVSEADVTRLRLGMEIYFTTLGNGSKRWYGKLRQILPTPEVVNNVVLYNAQFDVPNADKTLMTQMTAQVFFIVAAARNTVMVPFTALQQTQGTGNNSVRMSASGAATGRAGSAGSTRSPATDTRSKNAKIIQDEHSSDEPAALGRATVRVMRDGGRIEERQVEVGVTNRISAQILSGIEPGEQVVIGIRKTGEDSAATANRGPAGFTPHI